MEVLVLDTTVLANYFIGTSSHRLESSALLRLPFEFTAPDLWRAELASVFWKAVRAGHIAPDDALEMLPQAEELVSTTVSSQELWSSALTLAVEADHPVYDCLFVALAIIRDTMLVSYDLKLKAKFGDLVVLPEKVMS